MAKPINETHNEPSFYLEKLKNTQTKYHKLSQDEDLIKKKALREINLENQSKYFGYAGNQFFSFNDESYDYPYASPPQTRQQDPALQRKLEMDRMFLYLIFWKILFFRKFHFLI